MATCAGCGKLIVWAVSEDTGKNVPLDPSAPVYEVLGDEALGARKRARIVKTHMVNHFCTCSEANRFSGRNRK